MGRLKEFVRRNVDLAAYDADPRVRRLTRLAKWVIYPVVVVFIILALPLVGSFAVLLGAKALGCHVGEDSVHACHFLIWGVGDTVGLYGIGLFLAGVINPYLAFVALRAFLLSSLGIAWLLLVAGVLSVRAVVQRRAGNP